MRIKFLITRDISLKLFSPRQFRKLILPSIISVSKISDCKYLSIHKLHKSVYAQIVQWFWPTLDEAGKVQTENPTAIGRYKGPRNFALPRDRRNFIFPLVFADSFRQIGLAVYPGFFPRIHEREQSVRDTGRMREGGGGGR